MNSRDRRSELAAGHQHQQDRSVVSATTRSTIRSRRRAASAVPSTTFAGSAPGRQRQYDRADDRLQVLPLAASARATSSACTFSAASSPATAARWRPRSTASTWAARTTSAGSKSGASARWRTFRARPAVNVLEQRRHAAHAEDSSMRTARTSSSPLRRRFRFIS